MLREELGLPRAVKIRQYSEVAELPMGFQAQVDMGEKAMRDFYGKQVKVPCLGKDHWRRNMDPGGRNAARPADGGKRVPFLHGRAPDGEKAWEQPTGKGLRTSPEAGQPNLHDSQAPHPQSNGDENFSAASSP